MKIIYRTLSFRDTGPTIVYKEVANCIMMVINNVLLITTNLGLTLTGQTVSLILSTCVGSKPPRYIKGCACNIGVMKEFSFDCEKSDCVCQARYKNHASLK